MPDKGFFGSLFDVSFTSFATSRIIKVLYILTIVVIFLYALGYTIFAFAVDPGLGAFTLFIAAPIFVLLSLMWTRLAFELAIAVMRIMENTTAMVGGGPVPGVPSPAPAGIGGGPQPGALGTAPPPTAQPAAAPAPAQPAAPPAGGGPGQAAGWYPDPQGRARVRYWDGSSWTDHTAD